MFKRSKPVQKLVDLGIGGNMDDYFTMQELSEAAGVDVVEKPGVLASARRILKKQHGILTQKVHGGLKLCDGAGAASEARKAVNRATRAAGTCRETAGVASRRYLQFMNEIDKQETLRISLGVAAIENVLAISERKALEAK